MKTVELTSPATGLTFEIHMNGSDGYLTNPITGDDVPVEIVNDCLQIPMKTFHDSMTLSLDQASSRLGISPQGVCNLVSRGKIRAVSYQRVTRVLWSDVEKRIYGYGYSGADDDD